MTTQAYQDAYAAAWKALARKEKHQPRRLCDPTVSPKMKASMSGRAREFQEFAERKFRVLNFIKSAGDVSKQEIINALPDEGGTKIKYALQALRKEGRITAKGRYWVAV